MTVPVFCKALSVLQKTHFLKKSGKCQPLLKDADKTEDKEKWERKYQSPFIFT